MQPSEILHETNGLPFINTSFNNIKLLTLVATVRQNARPGEQSLVRYLMPNIATRLYQGIIPGAPPMPKHRPLSAHETEKVLKAKNNIAKLIPEWSNLFEIPLQTHKLLTGHASMSNPLLPQHLFLGQQAFISDTDLEESLVHELSHIWYALIAEIFDFQVKDCSHDYTLPSGTGGKDPRGVILACIFAYCTYTYHCKLILFASARARPARLHFLRSYYLKSLATLQDSEELSEMGSLIISRLPSLAPPPYPKDIQG